MGPTLLCVLRFAFCVSGPDFSAGTADGPDRSFFPFCVLRHAIASRTRVHRQYLPPLGAQFINPLFVITPAGSNLIVVRTLLCCIGKIWHQLLVISC